MASDIPTAFPQTEQCDAAAIDQPIASETRTGPPSAADSIEIPDDDCPCGCNRSETQQRFDTMPDEERSMIWP